MSESESHDQFAAVAPGALGTSNRRRENVGRMRRVLFPIGVVVVHAANHQRVGKCRVTHIHFLARADNGCRTRGRNFIQHPEGDDDIMLLITAQRAADGIEQEAFLLDINQSSLRESAKVSGHYLQQGTLMIQDFRFGSNNSDFIPPQRSRACTDELSVIPLPHPQWLTSALCNFRSNNIFSYWFINRANK